jgi:hypothetical protein
MGKFRVINDWHHRGVDPFGTFEQLKAAILTSPYAVILNGDVLDFGNCPYKDLPKLYFEAILIQNLVIKNGGAYVLGNHECDAFPAPNFVERGTTLFAHGDLWSWELDRAMNFRAQKKGGGWFKRNLISRPLSALRHLVAVRPNERLKEKIREYTDANTHIRSVVLGHSHPKEPVRFVVNGVNCLILPQGSHDIETL